MGNLLQNSGLFNRYGNAGAYSGIVRVFSFRIFSLFRILFGGLFVFWYSTSNYSTLGFVDDERDDSSNLVAGRC